MTTQDYNKALASMIKIIVANNAGGVARALMQSGYPTKNKIPTSELESALFTLHSASPEDFFKTIKNVPWLYNNNNWTNQPMYRDEIMKLVGKQSGSEVSKGNWWEIAVGLLGNMFNSQSSAPAPTESTGRGIGFWLGETAILITIIVLLVWGIKNIK